MVVILDRSSILYQDHANKKNTSIQLPKNLSVSLGGVLLIRLIISLKKFISFLNLLAKINL